MSDLEAVAETRPSYLDIIKDSLTKSNRIGFTCVAVIVGQFVKNVDRVEYSSKKPINLSYSCSSLSKILQTHAKRHRQNNWNFTVV